MSKKIVFKKEYSNFHPAQHWNVILLSSVATLLISIGYASYLYMYAKSEISEPVVGLEVATSTAPSSSSLSLGSLQSVKDIERAIEKYRVREVTYAEIMRSIRSDAAVAAAVVRATSTATTSSSTIATSTKQ